MKKLILAITALAITALTASCGGKATNRGGADNTPPSAFTDTRDGKTYRAVQIGKQTWMAENLNFKTADSKCYNNDTSYCAKYGRLYNWNDALTACPAGWHLPSEAEWETLVNFAGGWETAGTKLKSPSSYWNCDLCVPEGTDDYGFSALPGGIGEWDGRFDNAGDYGHWWSATEIDLSEGWRQLGYSDNSAWHGDMVYHSEIVNTNYDDKELLYSVRCVWDGGEQDIRRNDSAAQTTAPLADALPSWTSGETTVTEDDGKGTLTVSGNGAMKDNYKPWGGEMCPHTGYSVTDLIIEDGVTHIGNEAFRGLHYLESVTLPQSLKTIGKEAFAQCPALTSVTFPNGLTSIGDKAFAGCENLTSVKLPGSVAVVGRGAFWDCDSLASIEAAADNANYVSVDGVLFNKDKTVLLQYPQGRHGDPIPAGDMTSIGDGAFRNFNGLTSIAIPNCVTSIGEEAFAGCAGLESITLPDSVTAIGARAFSGCASLTSITIPRGVNSIGNSALRGCGDRMFGDYCDVRNNALTSIDVAADNANYASVDGVLFNKNKTVLIQYPQGRHGAYSIPNGAASIEEGAFFGCAGLTSVTIPNSVASIGREAFRGCDSLTSIAIPDGVASIGEAAFRNSGLTSIAIPDGVASIGARAFAWCDSLTSVAIPNSVTSIGESAFRNSGLTSVAIPNSVTSIGDSAFMACRGLTSVTIPNSVTSIGAGVFAGCKNLTSVTIPNSVTSIGEAAFMACSSLTSVALPDGVASIGAGAFEWCGNLASVALPNSLTSIGENAFYNYKSSALTSITIPQSVAFIGSNAFSYCPGLKSITVINPSPPRLERGPPDGIRDGVVLLYVPKGSIETYRAADEWKRFKNILPIME